MKMSTKPGRGDWRWEETTVQYDKHLYSVPDDIVMKACSWGISGPWSGVQLPGEASGGRFTSTFNEGWVDNKELVDYGAHTLETIGVAHAMTCDSKEVCGHRDMKFLSAGNMTHVWLYARNVNSYCVMLRIWQWACIEMVIGWLFYIGLFLRKKVKPQKH